MMSGEGELGVRLAGGSKGGSQWLGVQEIRFWWWMLRLRYLYSLMIAVYKMRSVRWSKACVVWHCIG